MAEVKILFLKPEEEKDKTHFTDKEVILRVLYMKVCDCFFTVCQFCDISVPHLWAV